MELKKRDLLWLSWMTFAVLFTACNKNKVEPNYELKLSTTEQTVYTDAIEYSFDIVSGNGDYQVQVEADNRPTVGKATVIGNHVKVDLICDLTRVTITDKSNQTASLIINSSNKSIEIQNHTISLPYGNIHRTTVDWGAGEYSILKQSGDAATLTIEGKNKFIVKSTHPGKAYFTIIDQRGTTNGIMVYVADGWDVTSSALKVDVLGDQIYTFPLKYGVGGWKITSQSWELPGDWQTCVLPSDLLQTDHDLLQVRIPDGRRNEILSIQLKDKANNNTTITMNVR